MSHKLFRAILGGLCASFLWAAAHGAVLHVPGDYAQIQSAINAGRNGDVVLVSPGTYYENINFKGKALTLSSTNPADPAVIQSTILHAYSPGSVLSFVSGETSNSIVTGFTITGGYGSVNPLFGSGYIWGGGIYCYTSSPTIFGNIIMGNKGPDGSASIYGYGSGLACIQSDATITRNVFAGNSGYAGGGVLVYLGNARITSNLILSNSAAVGGAVAMVSGGQVLNNDLLDNTAQAVGNIYAASDTNGEAVIENNIIANATAGGGVYVDSSDTITRFAFNDVWNNNGGNYYAIPDRTGTNGNISEDPQFVDPATYDYHLLDTSPCINAGDRQFQPLAGELDLYGDPRVSFRRVDIGASEYFDNYRPTADAGPDQVVIVTALPALFTLDGSASSDPNGAALSYQWSQVSGPTVSLNGAATAKPSFYAMALGTYVFQLVVNDGSYNSFADTVHVTVTNAPPIADAGVCKVYSPGTASITLDGSRSFDPEGVGLSYQWKQLSGWIVQLNNPNTVNPTFDHPWPGTYLFQLVVNDGLQDSQPATVLVVVGTNLPPVANPGLSRYVLSNSITLDGTGSYDPDGCGTLGYQWTQLSGPKVIMTGTNTATPLLSGFVPKTVIQKCIFQLVVSDGELTSQPTNVTVTIVPNYGTNALYLENPPFDPTRPTIVAFGGGNCTTGSGMSFGGVWDAQANWITVPSYTSAYNSYGDMLLVYLSSVVPNYQQAIQMIGFSTGNKPAMQAALYVNTTYKDARYAINRVALCDAVCNNLSSQVAQFQASPVGGEQCWVDSYVSNDPNYSRAAVIPGALNVVCNPARTHGYPVNRYASSSLDYTNGGLTAFGYLSVIGAGRNYQLNPNTNKYYFIINSSESIVFFNQTTYPGKILAPVQLAGPADGSVIGTNGAVFSCAPVENASHYQLLFGSDPTRVMDFSVISDTTNPPTQLISTLPLQHTWWTVKAYDRFASFIYADPHLISRPADRPPVADAGPDQVVYAGLDGKATVTLDGSKSCDPDGDALTYTWAWALDGVAYLTNAVSLTFELPVGTYTFQLMVNDGQLSSPPVPVNVTVVAPLECVMKVVPSAINLHGNGNGPRILARIQFPAGTSVADVNPSESLLLYPGGAAATRVWSPGGRALLAAFDKAALAGQVRTGPAELTVAGKLNSGRWFYGMDTVTIINGPHPTTPVDRGAQAELRPMGLQPH